MVGASKRRAAKGSHDHAQSSEDKPVPQTLVTSDGTDSTPQSIDQYDGNRDPPPTTVNVDYRNLENLGVRVHTTVQGISVPIGVARPSKPCFLGREVAIKLNTYNVAAYPTKIIFQHDVKVFTISKDPSKNNKAVDTRNILRKIWVSDPVKKALGGPGWIYDGNANAWSLNQLPKKMQIFVDLNVEQGRKPSPSGSNTFTFEICFTRKLDFAPLQGWLNNTMAWVDGNIATMSFLDHLLRAFPAQKYHEQRKSYFSRAPQTFEEIGAQSRTGPTGIECARGVFASLRPGFVIGGGARLTVNVDLANTTFFTPGNLVELAYKLAGHPNEHQMVAQFRQFWDSVKYIDDEADIRKHWRKNRLHDSWKRLNRLKVHYKHRPANVKGLREVYTIDRVLPSVANGHRFQQDERDDQGNVLSSKWVTVQDYFLEKYSIATRNYMPLVKMTKGDVVPMDCLEVPPFQRYPFKLQGSETDHMLRFCVSPPPQRWQSVETGIRMLNWPEDPFLKQYGLAIDKTPVTVKARYLDRPTIAFKELSAWDPKVRAQFTQATAGNKKAAPKGTIAGYPLDNGRWDLQGVQFSRANRSPLRSWGFAIVHGTTNRPTTSKPLVENWCKTFVQTYQAHGGIIERTQPPIVDVYATDGGDMILNAWNTIGSTCNQPPQLIFWVMPGKIAELYRRIKKSCDCRFGVASQCMQSAHIEKPSGQYCSNIAMKVNAKLGGVTCRTVSPLLSKLAGPAKKLTAIIGADVSHAAPGQVQASTASMTMSMDQFFCQYFARCETNGMRVEMIQTRGIETMLKPMLKAWMEVPKSPQNGRIPDRILYIRDGVSEGQYLSVVTEEVKDMKNLIRIMAPTAKVDFTVVIAAKRHHIRFFPSKQDGDRNENPKPGVLVDSGVTNPYEFDWYMCSHSAIKGTARPIHYHVILNENDAFKPDELQQMIFEHSFQYCRSTTPISQHPAVMYAHLASKRADAHFNAPHISSGKKDDKKDNRPPHRADEKSETSDSNKPPTVVPPLLKIPETHGLHTAMWFV